MVMLKSLFLAGLILSSAFAETLTSKPAMATLHVQPNFDFSLANKEFRVHYSGLGGFQTSDRVEIKIFRKISESDPKEVHSFKVAVGEEDKKKAYYFALDPKDVEDGEYEVEVCAGTECSGKTPALTEITDKKHQLTCEEGTKAVDGTWTKKGDFNLEFHGPLDDAWIPETEFEKIESSLNQAIRAAGDRNTVYKTDYKIYGLNKNPMYKKDGKIMYIAVKYDVLQYKQLFDKKRANEDRDKYAHDYCKRKYLLSAHTHLVDKTTKEVKYRYKTTLNLSGFGKYHFMMDPKAAEEQRKVHVEMTYKGVDIDDGTYQIHVIFCATDKDATDSTFCAKPIIHKDDFVVKSYESVHN